MRRRLEIFHALSIAGLITIAASRALPAQAPHGEVVVVVRGDSSDAPLADAIVRSGRAGGRTDEAGRVRLTLSPGAHWVVASRIGYASDSAAVSVAADSTSQVTIRLVTTGVELEELVVVSSTRVERHLDEEPVRVEVLGGEDVAEKTQMRPADLTRLLTEMVGVRMQPTGGALGSTRLRLQGLKGQYSTIVADGLPLYGAEPGGLALLQLAPLDLKQAEVIKGPATAFYGSSALGGVLNLISRRPGDGQRTLALNRTSAGGTDGLYWGGERLSPSAGFTIFADAHHQELSDISGDRWADYPRFTRFSLRPRVFLDRPNGDQFYATIGARAENRTGGFTTPGGYRETLTNRHLDGGLIYRRALQGNGQLTVRGSAMLERDDRDFGGALERNRRHTTLAELSWSDRRGKVDWVVGGALQDEALTARDVKGVSYDYLTPAGFAQLGLSPSQAFGASLALRCDGHDTYGTFCSPRAAVLLRPDPALMPSRLGGTRLRRAVAAHRGDRCDRAPLGPVSPAPGGTGPDRLPGCALAAGSPGGERDDQPFPGDAPGAARLDSRRPPGPARVRERRRTHRRLGGRTVRGVRTGAGRADRLLRLPSQHRRRPCGRAAGERPHPPAFPGRGHRVGGSPGGDVDCARGLLHRAPGAR